MVNNNISRIYLLLTILEKYNAIDRFIGKAATIRKRYNHTGFEEFLSDNINLVGAAFPWGNERPFWLRVSIEYNDFIDEDLW